MSDLAMEALKNIKMVKAARTEAQKVIEEDPEMKKHPTLSVTLDALNSLHFE
jgi:hypothetical protein